MNPGRRRWLQQLAGATAVGLVPATGHPAGVASVQQGRVLSFPRDHGAHLDARTEWWYATGWLAEQAGAEPSHGFQVTFFRSRTGLAQDNPSRFAARHLLSAHAALTTLKQGRHQHDQRLARWSGTPGAVLGEADTSDGRVRLGDWRLHRDTTGWHAQVPARGFTLRLDLRPTQGLLLQGDAGYSQKGPDARQASHYYSEPQLEVQASLPDETAGPARGRAWLDHEWSDELLHPQAVGWDWIGMNLFDGGALTAFVLRRADGSAVWAGGSHRAAGGAARSFTVDELRWVPGRRWASPGTGAQYPVEWTIDTPVGRFQVRALVDAQELDSRASTGTVYWEGLSELRDDSGRRVGLGYLEMTGYAAALRL
ncbi:MAG: carotenoid 1,2-hydratase [Rubrivivax sp.]|nr:carotenoid 1,2-hydratase [Rubrivivax sp.]